MDAYSICCTSPSRRNSSKIYQDLRSIRLHSLVDLDQDQLLRKLTSMEGIEQVRFLRLVSLIFQVLIPTILISTTTSFLTFMSRSYLYTTNE